MTLEYLMKIFYQSTQRNLNDANAWYGKKVGLLAALVIPGGGSCRANLSSCAARMSYFCFPSLLTQASLVRSPVKQKSRQSLTDGRDLPCGERGIRTPGPVARTTVFKTAAIDHSAISPCTCPDHSQSTPPQI